MNVGNGSAKEETKMNLSIPNLDIDDSIDLEDVPPPPARTSPQLRDLRESSMSPRKLRKRNVPGSGLKFLKTPRFMSSAPKTSVRGGRRGRFKNPRIRRMTTFGRLSNLRSTSVGKEPTSPVPATTSYSEFWVKDEGNSREGRENLSIIHESYFKRPTDFLLGTSIGQILVVMIFWAFMVWVGAVFFWWSGGSEAMDIGLPNDTFWDSVWASYIFFIDIGTQTGMHTSDYWGSVVTGVVISLAGFLFLLIILGIAVDLVRDGLAYYQEMHKKIVESDHFVVLGWSDKVLFLVEEIAQMVRSTSEFEDADDTTIVIMSAMDPVEIFQDLATAFGPMSGDEHYAFTYSSFTRTCRLHGVRLRFMKGDRTDPYALEKLSLLSAKHIVAIADPTKPELEADQDVVRTIMSIKVVELHRKIEDGTFQEFEENVSSDEDELDDDVTTTNEKGNDIDAQLLPRIVTEMRLRDNIPVSKRLGGGSVHCIVPRVAINKLLVLSSVTPIIGRTLRSLILFDDKSEIYEIRMSEHPWNTFVGCSARSLTTKLKDCIALVVCRDAQAATTKRGRMESATKDDDDASGIEMTQRSRNFCSSNEDFQVAHTISAAPGRSTTTKIIYERPGNVAKLRKNDSVMIASHDLRSTKAEAEAMSNAQLMSSIRSSKHKSSSSSSSSSVLSVLTSYDVQKKTKESPQIYSWERHERNIVIMGWASDLFDMVTAFAKASANVWSSKQRNMPIQVHLLGGPRAKSLRLMYWQHFVGSRHVNVHPDGKIEIDLVVAVRRNAVRYRHKIKVWHYVGRPARACHLPQLPIKNASAILILSDDDNESALASDSQILANLFLTASICRGDALISEGDIVEDEEDLDDDVTTVGGSFDPAMPSSPPRLTVAMTMSTLLGNSTPDVISKDDTSILDMVTLPPPSTSEGVSVASKPEKRPKRTQIICEILSPNTPKMVRVIDNPFDGMWSSSEDKNKEDSSSKEDSNANREAEVTYFCTHALETAVICHNCYNPAVAKFMEAMTSAMFMSEDAASSSALRLSCIRLKDAFEWKGRPNDPNAYRFSWRTLEELVFAWDERVLVAWRRATESAEAIDNADSLDGFCMNPLEKERDVKFSPDDMLIFL